MFISGRYFKLTEEGKQGSLLIRSQNRETDFVRCAHNDYFDLSHGQDKREIFSFYYPGNRKMGSYRVSRKKKRD
jgi:hypothetical protein